ncbi:hypothetical protein L5876_00980 [Hyphobacterium sp. SN044]|uniref:hypothetical protein n=1 Tax=Hyphobacterium sp. SN044 TaxID=2912575 RepID=UPI001F34C210|nr:hypothetical protein [Hyphobacterium sp. SN044]MCF8878386.1 hypothetical protein [Hyphobacterium sp. SN044]
MTQLNPGEEAVGRLFPNFATDPDLYLYRIEPIQATASVMVMDEAAYNAARFMNKDIVTLDTLGANIPLFRVTEYAQARTAPAKPVHFILHLSHTGSTLISRLLDATGTTLGVREPWPLITLAELQDDVGQKHSVISDSDYAVLRDSLVTVWSRVFRPETTGVVKATSHAGRAVPDILRTHATSRAISLTMQPEAFITALLARQNPIRELLGFSIERMKRFQRYFGDLTQPVHAMTPGEHAALAWLVERQVEHDVLTSADTKDRVIDVDFDVFLDRPVEELGRIAEHLQLGASDAAVDAAATGPLMSQYSKAAGQSFTPEMRKALMEETRQVRGGDIARGMAWLDRVAKASPAAAALRG